MVDKEKQVSVYLYAPQVFASLRAFMVELVRQIGDKVLEVSELQRTPHLLVGVGVEGVKVHPQGA